MQGIECGVIVHANENGSIDRLSVHFKFLEKGDAMIGYEFITDEGYDSINTVSA